MDLTLKYGDNEVLRKIGRNIVLYQYVELLLKILLINGKFSGPANDIQEIRKKRVETVRRQTMGNLTSDFLADLVNQPEGGIIEADNPDKDWMHFSYSVGDSDTYAQLQEKLSAIVDERNKLVHHLFENWGLDLSTNGKALENYLDGQYAEIQATIEYLVIILDGFQNTARELIAFVASREFGKFNCESGIYFLLLKIAQENKRPDGWVDLALAGSLIKQQAAEMMTALKEKYGHKTLKAFLLEQTSFGIREEPTPGGGTRVLYRIKE